MPLLVVSLKDIAQQAGLSLPVGNLVEEFSSVPVLYVKCGFWIAGLVIHLIENLARFHEHCAWSHNPVQGRVDVAASLASTRSRSFDSSGYPRVSLAN